MKYTSKDLAAIHAAKFKETKYSLAGAVKLYCKLFGGNTKELASDLKAVGAKYNPAALKAINTMAKDKERVLRICSACLPSIDGVFVKYVVTERYHYVNGVKVTIDAKDDNYINNNVVIGLMHKPIGLYALNPYGDGDGKKTITISRGEKYNCR